MPNIFERLQHQLDIQKREQGISALELRDLPPALRRIMRLMLRELVLKHGQIQKAMEEMPEANRLSPAELEAALKTLVEQNWLLTAGEGEFLSYRVNLRRKAGSNLDTDIWSALNARMAGKDMPAAPEDEPAS